MADLIAIGYPDETTAVAAADEARGLAADLIIQPDAIAVIGRRGDEQVRWHGPEDVLVQGRRKELQDALHGSETAAQ